MAKGAIKRKGEKTVFSIGGAKPTGYPPGKNMKLDLYLNT